MLNVITKDAGITIVPLTTKEFSSFPSVVQYGSPEIKSRVL